MEIGSAHYDSTDYNARNLAGTKASMIETRDLVKSVDTSEGV